MQMISGAPDLPRHRGQISIWNLLIVNAYKCIKFQLPSCISFKDTVVFQNKKWGLLIFSGAP